MPVAEGGMISRLVTCPVPGCPRLTGGGRCPVHLARPRQASATARGYGSEWRRIRKAFLAANPRCVGDGTGSHHPSCDGYATIPDHDPITRAELVRMGVPDPDAFYRMKPRSKPCHNSKTLRFDGAWGNPKVRR